MLLDRQRLYRLHFYWILTTGLIALLAAVFYWNYASSEAGGPRGGTWQGMLFGVAGTICMVVAGMLAAKKRAPKWQSGSAQAWLKCHLWIGLLSVPLIFFHCGFRWGGLLERSLLITFAFVIASGIHGLVLQQLLPRMMSNTASAQAIAPQVHVACERLQRMSEILVQKECGQVFLTALMSVGNDGGFERTATEESAARKDEGSRQRIPYSPERELALFYCEHIGDFLTPNAGGQHPMANPTIAAARFARLKVSVSERLRPVVDELQSACDERRELISQSRIHYWLHNWLCLHVPLCVLLLVFGIVHIVMSVYY